jgi:NAD(P) transhydrogenase subunit beta
VETALVKIAYLIAAMLFILGLKQMGRARTAVRGNLLSAIGMTVAVVATLIGIWRRDEPFGYIIAGTVIGATIGIVLAQKIKMTAMPQLVALFNGFGGGASVFVAGAYMIQSTGRAADPQTQQAVLIATALSGIIGAITFWGSLVAFGKLQEISWMKKPFRIPSQQLVNAGLAAFVLLVSVLMVMWGLPLLYIVLVILASVLGLCLVNPIGGADMPVVIALLNSYSGLAAAATGFVIDNNVLIIAGSLVGASGIILTQLMCKAMNRSLFNVLFGVMGERSSGGDVNEIYANVRTTSADEVAMILETAGRVVFVPGYGMAVAQAQHAVRNLGVMLEEKGVIVEYAIHPVAGRMPGHMNVLLAEADVEYEQLKEMDAINPTLETVDVAIVIGANDVVNPVARTDPKSPIAGMPVINIDKARTVIVIKRSLSPGFAGIPNPLFAMENTLMLFGDGQQAVLDIVAAIKES